MTFIERFDHVGITVADLDGVTAFFVALGLEAGEKMAVEGEFLDTVIGMTGARTEIVMLHAPGGGTTLELSSFTRPDHLPGSPAAPATELGLRNQAVEDLTEAIRISGDGLLHANRAIALQELGNHRQAVRDLAAGADDPDLLYLRGASRQAVGDDAGAPRGPGGAPRGLQRRDLALRGPDRGACRVTATAPEGLSVALHQHAKGVAVITAGLVTPVGFCATSIAPVSLVPLSCRSPSARDRRRGRSSRPPSTSR